LPYFLNRFVIAVANVCNNNFEHLTLVIGFHVHDVCGHVLDGDKVFKASVRQWKICVQGSVRLKLARSVRQSMMKGNQDYSLNMNSTDGQLSYLRFMSAQQQKSGFGDSNNKVSETK
jgi:hypothetical protein